MLASRAFHSISPEEGKSPRSRGLRRASSWNRRGVLWLVAIAFFGTGFLLGLLCAPSVSPFRRFGAESVDSSTDAVDQERAHVQGRRDLSEAGTSGRSAVEVVAAALLATQNPTDCAKARYLIVDEFSDQHGLGFSLITVFKFLYVAHVERRVLLLLPSFTSYPWRWCHWPPASYGCYFEDVTYCATRMQFDQALRDRVIPRNWSAIPDWKGIESIDERVVIFRQKYLSRARIESRAIYQAWSMFEHAFGSGLKKYGRFFYYAVAQRVLLQPKVWLEHAALTQRERWSLEQNDPLVVVHARHGSKHIEQKHIPVSELAASALAFCECLGVRDILLITETERVIVDFKRAVQHAPVRVLYTEYWRPEGDVWNKNLVGQLKLKPVNDSVIDVIAYHSILNLLLARTGVAFVGTIQSAFLKLLVSTAYAHQKAPVSIHSLRAGWRIRDGYPAADAKYWSFDPCRLPHPCEHVALPCSKNGKGFPRRSMSQATDFSTRPADIDHEPSQLHE